MKMTKLMVTICVLLTAALSSGTASAAVLFSDDFSGAGSGTGFSDSWSAGDYTTAPGQLNVNSAQAYRTLSTTIDTATMDFWMSIDMTLTGGSTSGWGGFSIYSGTNEDFFVGSDTASVNWEFDTDGYGDQESTVPNYTGVETHVLLHITGNSVQMWIDPDMPNGLGAADKEILSTDTTPNATWTKVRIGTSLNLKVNDLVAATTLVEVTDVYTAHTPTPTDGEVLVDPSGLALSWLAPNAYAPTGYDVYLDPNETKVLNGDISVQVADKQAGTSHTPSPELTPDTTYYWRVDAYEPNTPADTLHAGEVWSFTTSPATPLINESPASRTVAQGESTTFTVDQSNGTAFQWYFNGSPISGATGESYTIASVLESDEGVYTCNVSNALLPGGIDTEPAYLWTERLIAHWTLDDINDPNSIVAGTPDTIANGAPASVSGMIGQAYQFNGVDDFLYVPDSNSYFDAMYTACTVSCWIKTTSTADWSAYVSKYGEGSEGWQLRDQGYVGQNQATFTTRGTGNVDGEATGVVVTDGEWHYVVGTFDSEIKNVYVDGLLISSLPVTGPIASTDLPVAIGARIASETTYSGPFTGAIDDVRLYNYPMSDIEVARMYADTTNEPICLAPPTADLDGDCDVDLADFALLAANWLLDNTVSSQ